MLKNRRRRKSAGWQGRLHSAVAKVVMICQMFSCWQAVRRGRRLGLLRKTAADLGIRIPVVANPASANLTLNRRCDVDTLSSLARLNSCGCSLSSGARSVPVPEGTLAKIPRPVFVRFRSLLHFLSSRIIQDERRSSGDTHPLRGVISLMRLPVMSCENDHFPVVLFLGGQKMENALKPLFYWANQR